MNITIYNDLIIPKHIDRYRIVIDDDTIINHHIYNINKNNNIESIVKKAFMELNIIRHILGRRLLYNKRLSELCFKLACQRIIKLLN